MLKERNNFDFGSYDYSDLELFCYMFDILDVWCILCYLRYVEMNVFEKKKLLYIVKIFVYFVNSLL